MRIALATIGAAFFSALVACGASTTLEQANAHEDASTDIAEGDITSDATVADTGPRPDVCTEIRGWDPIRCMEISACLNTIWDSGVPLEGQRPAFVCCERSCVAGTLCPISFEPRGLCGPDGPPCDLAIGELCCPLPTGYQCLRVGRRGCPRW
jgi:hypothetical protein